MSRHTRDGLETWGGDSAFLSGKKKGPETLERDSEGMAHGTFAPPGESSMDDSPLKLDLLVMCPHPQHFHSLQRINHLVDKTVLDVNSSRIGSLEIPSQHLEGRRHFKWIQLED